MNILRRVLWVCIIFILIVILISLFLPSNFKVEKKVVINADKQQIFNQVNDLKNWLNWSTLILKDESIFSNNDNYVLDNLGRGTKIIWQSENKDLGKGRLEVLKSSPSDSLKVEMNIGSYNFINNYHFYSIDEGVEVVWESKTDFGFNPFTKFYGLFVDEFISSDIDMSLKKLKSYAENLPKIHSVKVKRDSVDLLWFLSIRDTLKPVQMNNIHGKMYAQINQFMDENNISISGSPIVIYHLWSDTLIDIEAGLPVVDSLVTNNDRIKLNKIDEGKVVTAIHHGHYDRLPETYFGINEWMRKNKVVVRGPLWEVYITDPALEPNPEKWQTAIYFPIN